MKAKFTLEVSFDENITDAESIAVALDRLLDTSLFTSGILDDYGNLDIGEFLVLEEEE